MWNYAKMMSVFMIFSGPLSNWRYWRLLHIDDSNNDDMYGQISILKSWLSRWCPANGVDLINWQPFWGRPGLIRRDSIHPALNAAAPIFSNLAKFIVILKSWQPRIEARRDSQVSMLPLVQSPANNQTDALFVPRPPKCKEWPSITYVSLN